MTTDNRNQTIDRGKLAHLTWITMLSSGPVIFAFLYFSGAGEGSGGIPAKYDLWFLVAGIASAAFSVPRLRRFREATAAHATDSNDEAYWQKVGTAMSMGNAIAEIPLFIGFAAYLAGGFVQTALLLMFVSLVLQSRYKPPLR